MATILPNSGMKRPNTPASFIIRSKVSGVVLDVRTSRKIALA
jgi:hypothetical protein